MNFAAFDLNLLRIFNALMRERSATRAGEQVGLSQPAVSAALNRLRDLLDDKLFVRHGNEMIPTPRAESLAPGIQDALEELEHLLAVPGSFDPARIERSFTLMGADFFAILLVPDLVRRLRSISNGISLRFLDTARGDVGRLLSDDAIDMALEAPFETAEWINSELLFMAPFKVAIAADHPLLAEIGETDTLPREIIPRLDWALRASDGSLRGRVDDALAEQGLSRRVVLSMPHFAPLVDCVAANRLATAIPTQFAEIYARPRGLRIFHLPFDPPSADIRLYWHSRRTRDPAHAWLRKIVHELCEPFRSIP